MLLIIIEVTIAEFYSKIFTLQFKVALIVTIFYEHFYNKTKINLNLFCIVSQLMIIIEHLKKF